MVLSLYCNSLSMWLQKINAYLCRLSQRGGREEREGFAYKKNELTDPNSYKNDRINVTTPKRTAARIE